MKVILTLLVSLCFLSAVQAQENQVTRKYWIFLKDKTGHSGKMADVEADHLSLSALSRRARRATTIPPDRDVPLSAGYLQDLRALDVEPLVLSRWLNAVSAFLDPGQVEKIRKLSFVTSIRLVAWVQPLASVAPLPEVMVVPIADVREVLRLDYGASQGQLELVNAILPLEEGLKGAGVKLGIIDTGMGDLPTTHPATAQMIAEGRFVASEDFTGLSPDGSRHGYSVLSVAAGYDPGELIGPAYGAEVYHARTEYAPTETNQEEDNLVKGIEWMEAQGVDVVNISLGYSVFDIGQSSYTIDDLDGNTGIATIAADMAVEMGMIIVNSAGNEGCSSPDACWYFITMPADGDLVITVGAVNPVGNIVSFSSRGPTADGRIKPDVVALGSSVYLASSGNYASSSGTSFSSPMVAGVVALMLEANPALIPEEVRMILRNTASQANAPGNNLGWGIIDADAAVQAAQDMISTQTEEEAYPEAVVLEAPYPNPFVGQTAMLLRNNGQPVRARLVIYNSLGRMVFTAFDGTLVAGRHRISIDMSEQPSGLYFYRLETRNASQSGTFIRL